MTKVQIKRSSESGKAPASADLDVGELAINLADRRIYSKTQSGEVVEMTTARRIDGGSASSVYLPTQIIDGGAAHG